MQKNNYGGFDEKYFVPSPDPIMEMLDKDRKDLLERIDMLDKWLDQRKKILYDNLGRIGYNICRVDSSIRHSEWTNPYDHRDIQGLEKSLIDLEQQKRMENTGAWKDMWLVSKELLELTRQYQQQRKREQVMK